MGVKIIALLATVLFNILAISCSNEETTSENEVTETVAGENNGITVDTPNEPTQSTTLKILPLGDSRVEGDRPDYESYRYELWKLLVDNNIDFDYIGTKKDEAQYPDYKEEAFDVDHEGTGGATTDFLLDGIENTLENEVPDLVLLGIGGNDLNEGVSIEGTITNIVALIDNIQSRNSNVTIILEQIAPAKSSFMTEERYIILEDFNEEIAKLAANKSVGNLKVITVDMASDWSDDYLADDLHYNEEGAREVASRYYKVFESLELN